MTDEQAGALQRAKGLELSPKNLTRLAAVVGDEMARWAFEQARLRRRGLAKFERAGEMLFVQEALEQATNESVARDRANRFPDGELVLDATCGIGGDLIALAGRGSAIGWDLDEQRVSCANHNLTVHGHPACARVANCLQTEWGANYAIADPSRRAGGERKLDPNQFEPRPFAVAERMAALRLGALKLSPMMRDTTLERLGPRLEFVEFGGECREAVVWCGSQAQPGRFARSVERNDELSAQPLSATVEAPTKYLAEASPATIRAHCLGQFGLPGLGDSPGYLCAETPPRNPWLSVYPVLWHGKFDAKSVTQALRRLDAQTPEIKQRGAKQNLVRLRQAWKGDGLCPVVVFLWIVGKSLKAAITAPRLSPH